MEVKNDKEFHKEVCKRDNYKCQRCGRDFNFPIFFEGDLNQVVCGHHIKTKKAFPELRYETDNGMCVCDYPDEFCHTKIHKGL